jgi:hypothetical protein
MTLGGVQPLANQPQLQPGIINADGSPYTPPTDFTKIAADIPKARAITTDDTAILQALVQKNPQILPDVTTAIAERHATPTQVLDHIQQQYGQQQDQGVGGAQGFALGAAKGAFGTLNTISDIGQSILSQTVGRLVNAATGKGFGATDKALIDKQNLQAHGTAETLGKIAENTAEFFIPGGAVGKVGKVADAGIEGLNLADKLGTAGKVVAGALKLGTKAALGAGEAAGITALQGGTAQESKNAAYFGAAAPAIGAVFKGLSTTGKAVMKFTASTESGVPLAAINHAIENPEAVGKAITAAVRDGGEATMQKILNESVSSLEELKSARRVAFDAGLAKLEKEATYTKSGQLYVKRALTNAEAVATKGYVPGTVIGVPTELSTRGVKQVMTSTLKDFGVKAAGRSLDFTEAALDKTHANKLDEVVNRIYDWKNTTPTGINQLRRVIDGYRLGGISLGSSEKQFNAIIGAVRTNLADYVGTRVPQVAEMNSKYAVQSEAINNIIDQLKMNSKDPNTALRKLVNVFNPKSEVYRPVVEQLGTAAGKDLMSQIAGLTMSQWTPEGLGKYVSSIMGGAGAVATIMHPVAALGAIPAALMASPRIVGKTATALGKISQSGAANVAGRVIPRIAKGLGTQIARQSAK